MKIPSRSFRRCVTSTLAAACMSSVVSAQGYPPPPPSPIRIVQAAEPTLIGPLLPGSVQPTPVAPSPMAPAPGAPTPAAPTPVDAVPMAPLPDDLPLADPSTAVPENDVEAFARGPVHEAFADVYDVDPVTGEIIATAPPAVVDELPPEQAPAGENVLWISGYWAWDAETKDYFWVSGVWRDAPPGRRWVPGYWAEVTGGYQWVGGFWADAQSSELTYVPPPPESLEIGPNVPPPSEDQIWVPGNWTYVSNQYHWAPGYYTACQPDYMWVPNQYCYTPRGFVYVPGYWDYRFARRGVLFTPVRFRRPLYAYGYARPAWYRPRFSITMSNFMIHLFVRPRHRHFYYGDYYGSHYAGIGFTPWYRRSFAHRHFADPALSFYRWDSRQRGIDFDRSLSTWHDRYERNSSIRPPRYFHDQDQFLTRHSGDRTAELAVLARRFDDVTRKPGSGEAFRRIERDDLELLRENSRVNRQLESTRRQIERDHSVARIGESKPGAIVDLRHRDVRDRLDRDRPSGDGDNRTRDSLSPRSGRDGGMRDGVSRDSDKLVLTDLPEKLRERTRDSIAHAEQIRTKAGLPATGERPRQIPFSGGDRGHDADRTRQRMIGETGRPDRELPHKLQDDDRSGITQSPSTGGSRLDDIRRRIEDRTTRDAGSPKFEDGASRSESRERPTTRLPAGSSDSTPTVRNSTPGRVDHDNRASQRIEEIRQQTEQRRQARESTNGATRELPRVDSKSQHRIESTSQPRSIDLNRPAENSIPRERISRERDSAPRISHPEPVIRQHHIDRAPVERAPHIERSPVERAPRMERAPVERAPVERAPRIERAPVERAPRMERAPVERAPRSERGSSSRRGRD